MLPKEYRIRKLEEIGNELDSLEEFERAFRMKTILLREQPLSYEVVPTPLTLVISI